MIANPQKLLTPPQAAEIITILSVSPFDEDHAVLEQIFNHRNWRLIKARSCAEGREKLSAARVSVVLCERELCDGDWKQLLSEASQCDDVPQLIVMSRLADERLWAEVLNLGGYDVIEKPFNYSEVMRVVSMAWRQYRGFTPAPVPMRVSESGLDRKQFNVSFSAN